MPATVTKALKRERAPRKAPVAAPSPLAVESWPIDRLVPFVGNARRLSDNAVVSLAAVLKKYGWRQPIVVDKKDVIIAGHTRRLAAMHNGWTEVPVHVASNLTAAEVAAYRLADNRISEETSWNMELLGPALAKLEKESYDLSLTGFSEEELNRFLRTTYGTEAITKEDDVPRLPNGRFRGRGGVWLLGKHYLVCDSAGDGSDVAAVVEAWEKFTGETAKLQQ